MLSGAPKLCTSVQLLWKVSPDPCYLLNVWLFSAENIKIPSLNSFFVKPTAHNWKIIKGRHILTFERLEWANIWHFSLLNDLKSQ